MLDKARVTTDEVIAFRERHGLDQAALDRLVGFTSKGRATRRWESQGAPAYVGVLFAYADKYGLEVMEQLAQIRDRLDQPAIP